MPVSRQENKNTNNQTNFVILNELSNSSIFGFQSKVKSHFSFIIDCTIGSLWLVFFESGSWIIDDLESGKYYAFFEEANT